MEIPTENAAEKSVETGSKKKPFSKYSVSFKQILNDAEREFLIEHSKTKKTKKPETPKRPTPQSPISKAVFNWRNAIAIGAILTVAILHFAFQISFIQLENSQNQTVAEGPRKIEEVPPPSVESQPAVLPEAVKTDSVVPVKTALPLKAKPIETAAPKTTPATKKPVDGRAARLRRAEKILTGI